MPINGLEITDIHLFPIKNKQKNSSLVAYTRLEFNNILAINGVEIYEINNELYVRFPQVHNSSFCLSYDICFILTDDLKSYITDCVSKEYYKIPEKLNAANNET